LHEAICRTIFRGRQQFGSDLRVVCSCSEQRQDVALVATERNLSEESAYEFDVSVAVERHRTIARLSLRGGQVEEVLGGLLGVGMLACVVTCSIDVPDPHADRILDSLG